MIMQKLSQYVNKIQRLSLKEKLIIFIVLFILSSAWVVFRNPVYIGTTAYIFPQEDTGDGRVYWGIKNGYNKYMSNEIPPDAYYTHINSNASSIIKIEDKDDDTIKEEIPIKDGINFYYIKGDVIRFERIEGIEEVLELPKKEGIQLLTVQNGQGAELYLSSVQVWYQKQLLNRDVATTFPFYLAYTTPQRIAFDKSIPDNKLYDVSYERRQWFADAYLDPALPHYIAKNFRRSIDFPFGHSRLLTLMSLLASLALTGFLFFVPYYLLKTFVREGTNRLLFIGLGVYLVIMWLVFRHSLYRNYDGMLTLVVGLNYHPVNSHALMLSEYIFYLIGYSSRAFISLFQLCLIVWSFNKILSVYFFSNVSKIIKYIFLAVPLLAPYIVMAAVSGRRDNSWVLWIFLSYIYFIRTRNNKEDDNKKTYVISFVCLLLGIAHRIDTVIFSIPYLFFFWNKKRTLKNTMFTGILCLLIAVYTLLTGIGTNTTSHRKLMVYVGQVDYALLKYKEQLSDKDKSIISDVYAGGFEFLSDAFSLHWPSYKINNPLTSDHLNGFRNLAVKTILIYPKEYLKRVLYKHAILSLQSSYMQPFLYYPSTGTTNHMADLPHKHNIFKMAFEFGTRFHKDIIQNIPISLFTLLVVSILFFRKSKLFIAINATFLLYYCFIVLAAPWTMVEYTYGFHFWSYFILGFIICEIIKSGSIKKKWFIPANLIIILTFFAFNGRYIRFEYQGPIWNDEKALYQREISIFYPFYYRVFPKRILLSAINTAPAETFNYSMELTAKNGERSYQAGSFEPINKNILETTRIPASTSQAKIIFESKEANIWIDINPVLDIRKHVYAVLLFLFLYVNVSFFKRKLIIICVRWKSTAGNHTGQAHDVKHIARKFNNFAQIIYIPHITNFWQRTVFYGNLYRVIKLYLSMIVSKNDILYLTEYFHDSVMDGGYFSKYFNNKLRIIAISHLSPQIINDNYSEAKILEYASYVNRLLVFGNSARNYFISKGLEPWKVVYFPLPVNNSYYIISERIKNEDKPLFAVVIGNMLRNYDDTLKIVALSPEIYFHVFLGRDNFSVDVYKGFPNVMVHVNIKEADLRSILHSSDISLNVMQDTIGSNVIVTAMASGLAMVCSDIGSIRDYVTPESGILFNSVEEAVESLNRLNNDRELLYVLQNKSLMKAQDLDIEKFVDWWHRNLIAGLDE